MNYPQIKQDRKKLQKIMAQAKKITRGMNYNFAYNDEIDKYFSQDHRGNKKNNRYDFVIDEDIFSQDPKIICHTASVMLQSLMVSRAENWYQTYSRNASRVGASYMYRRDEMTFEYLLNSNFYTEDFKVTKYGLRYGHVAVQVLSYGKDKPLSMKVFENWEVCWKQTLDEPDTFVIETTMTEEQMLAEYDRPIKEKEYSREIGVTQYIYPNPDKKSEMKFITKVFTDEEVLMENYYTYCPIQILIWERESLDSILSPAKRALVTAKRLNLYERRIEEATTLMLDPPIQGGAGALEAHENEPGHKTSVESHERSLSHVQPTVDLNPALAQIQSLKQTVRDIFYLDFLTLAASEKTQKREVTAAEIRAIQQEKSIIMEHFSQVIEDNFLRPLLKKITAVLTREKLLPPVPKSMENEIVFTGVLSKLRRQNESSKNVQSIMELAQAIGSVQPEALDNLDMNELMRHAASVSPVGATFVKDKAEVEKIRQERQQLMEAQQRAEILEKASKAQQNLQPAQ